MELPQHLRDLLAHQQGLASRAQLLAVGISKSALSWRLGRPWQVVLPGVVATFTGRLDPGQWLVAAQLYAGESAVISSWTAAAWHGVESARQSQFIRVMVPDRLAARRSGPVIVSRTSRPDAAAWQRGPLFIASRARAVIDAARDVRGDRRAGAIVVEAVQRQLVTVDALRHELECGPRHGSAQARRAVRAAETGAWSMPEVDLLDILAESPVLPEVWANPQLSSLDGTRLPTPDAWVDEIGLAIQVHSRAYHLREQDWNLTVSKDSVLGEHGIVILAVTPERLRDEPSWVRLRAEHAYQALRDRPRPEVVAVPQFRN